MKDSEVTLTLILGWIEKRKYLEREIFNCDKNIKKLMIEYMKNTEEEDDNDFFDGYKYEF